MEPNPVRAEAQRFFDRLCLPCAQFRELRLINPSDGRVVQRYCQTTSEAIAIVRDATGRLNAYVGACPRSRRSGTRDAVRLVSGVWADLDFHQIDPTSRDVALELAYRRIEALGIPATMLVHTGNGLQAWWLLHEPAAITHDWPAERFESINIGLADRLGGDHVHDLARVLRVPGTMNLPDAKKRARGCVPVMARLLDVAGPMYRPEELLPLAGTVKTVPASGGSERWFHRDPIEALDEELIDAFQRLLQRLGPHHPLTRTWEGRRLLRDSTRSGFDWALALQCARVGVKPDRVAALMRTYGFGKGHDASNAYLLRTVARAYAHESHRHAR